MNKLFTKIAALALGATMAVGVGVAVASSPNASQVYADTIGNWTQVTATNQIAAGDKIVLVTEYNSTKYYMNNSVNSGHFQAGTFTSSVTDTTNGVITLESTGTANRYKLASRGSTGYVTSKAAKSGSGQFSASDSSGWNFSLNGSDWDIVYNANSTYLRAYQNSFRTYAGRSNNACLIYKYSASHTITFNANGGTGTVPSSITGSGSKTLPSSASLTKTGYTLDGWGDSSHKDAATAQYALGASYTLSADITLYAHWTATTYNITYALNGGTHGSTHPTSGKYDTAFSVSAPTKTGYTFTGWTVTSGLNSSTAKWGTTSSPSTAISSSSTLCVNGTNAVYFKNINAASTAVTLTANWSINSYTVGGTISDGHLSSTANVNYNAALDITIVPDQDYTYPSSIDSVTMGGAAYAGYEYDSTDGSFSIEHVTGNVVINAACVSTSATERFFDYHLTNCSIENAPESMYDTEMKLLQIVADDHYKFPSSITVTGISVEKWEYDADEGTILIDEPDGDIDITVTCVAKAQNIITIGTLTGVTQKSGDPTTVEEDEIVTLTFIASSGYGLPTSSGVTVTGVDSQSWSWDQNSGELEILGGTSNITVSVVATQRDLTDDSLALGTKQTEYKLGDDFVKPTTITAKFNLAPTTVDVKNDVVVTGPVNDDLVVTGSGTITITYTFPATGSTQSASYPITATPITPSSAEYRKVTSISAGTYLMVYEEGGYAMSTTQGSNNRDSVSVTISDSKITSVPATAQVLTVSQTTIDNKTGWQFYTGSGYLYAASSSSNYLRTQATNNANGLFTANFSGGDVTLTAQGSNTRNIIRFNTASDQLKFSCYASTSGLPVVQLYKYYPAVPEELKWITAEVKSGTYYQGNSVTASDFTVTAHYNNGDTSTLSSGVTVTNGYLANIGNNEVTLTYSGKSCKVNVKAVEQTAEYTGLSWTQGEYTVIDGQNIDFSKFGTVTAEYDDGESYATKAISSCTVATYTKSGDVYTKVADLSDGVTITSSSHGKYLGVTYTETNTFTAYSSAPIYVVESIEDVFVQEKTYTWTKVSSIAVGDTVLLTGTKADGTEPHELSGVTSNSGTIASFSSNPAGTYRLTVVAGASSGSFAFKDADDNYLYHSGTDKTLSLSDKLTDASSWTVEFDSETPTKATVTNVDSGNPLQYNPGNYFRVYASASQQPIQFYKGESGLTPTGDSIANTNAVVQKAVLQFAEHFNDTMDCVNSGATTSVQSKWSTLSSDFTTAMSGFTGDDLAHFKALFAYAYSVEGGDTLQDMLARYDYIIAKYQIANDFLHSGADRPEVVQRPNVNPLVVLGVGESANTIAIVVIVSVISLSAIGGYFFLRKRKEN